jgi:tRNA-2-methylthio-N6-dimethylallyladenosine synthase/ribosomal protein S12 methylthiotransferase
VGRVWFQAPEVDGVTYVSGPKVKPGRMVMADIEQAQSYDLVALA